MLVHPPSQEATAAQPSQPALWLHGSGGSAEALAETDATSVGQAQALEDCEADARRNFDRRHDSQAVGLHGYNS